MEGGTSRCGRTYFVAGQHKNSERCFFNPRRYEHKGNMNPVQQYLGRLQQWCFPRVEFSLRRHFPVYRWRAYFKLCLVYPDLPFFSQPGRYSRLADRRAELNITDFTARMMCELSSTSDGRRSIILKFQILIFLATYLEIFENPDARFGSFPGIKVADGNFLLLPRPTTPWAQWCLSCCQECRTSKWRRPRRAADSKMPSPPSCGRQCSRWRWTRARSPSDGSTSLPVSLSFSISPATGLLSGVR